MWQRWLTVAVLVAVLGTVLVGTNGCSPPSIQSEEAAGEPRTISVSGSGTVSAQPDRVVLRLGVEVMADTAARALSQNGSRMQAVVDALKEAGIPAADIQTQTVELRPQYETPEREPTISDQPGMTARRPELVGYVASNVVEVRSEDLDGVGELLDAAVQAGANQVEGIRFEVSNSSEMLTEARQAAWQDAEQKAQQLATLADVALGDVLSVQESTTAPRPVGFGRGVEMEAAVPIEPGTEALRVDLQVTWTLR